MARLIYKEKQNYRDYLNFVALGFLVLWAVYAAVESALLIQQPDFMRAGGLVGFALIVTGFIIFLAQQELKISITEKSIKYKLDSFNHRTHKIHWSDVKSYQIVETSEVEKLNGANLSFGDEQRVTFNGRNGLALKLRNGERYFIGSQNIDELRKAMQRVEDSSSQLVVA